MYICIWTGFYIFTDRHTQFLIADSHLLDYPTQTWVTVCYESLQFSTHCEFFVIKDCPLQTLTSPTLRTNREPKGTRRVGITNSPISSFRPITALLRKATLTQKAIIIAFEIRLILKIKPPYPDMHQLSVSLSFL